MDTFCGSNGTHGRHKGANPLLLTQSTTEPCLAQGHPFPYDIWTYESTVTGLGRVAEPTALQEYDPLQAALLSPYEVSSPREVVTNCSRVGDVAPSQFCL